MWALRFGANVVDGGVQFRVWAPRLKNPALVIEGSMIPMHLEAEAEFAAFVPGLEAGTDYAILTDSGAERPDPVSRFQPHGVHGPSRIVDPNAFPWRDQHWKGLPLKEYIIYELHTGTFTPEGTFEAIIPKLAHLRDVGITAVEIMPVAEFPGKRNWGYDGVASYAPQSSYGGPTGLKRLIDACHREGLAVVLDVVYNHLGPEGNYLAEFGPYFTDSYKTPWGCAINYDGPDSDGVREHFINNALYWLTEYHVDALRLDAIHGIFDFGARHVLEELTANFNQQARELDRMAWVIAESDLNDIRVIKSVSEGGYGLDAQWNDDFHHSLYSLLTGDRHGYFVDFGSPQDLAKALREGFVYDGKRSSFRRRRHGSPSHGRPGQQFVVFTQNHDQIANALAGNRLSKLLSAEQQKLSATVLLCAPFIPLLFMGQEYGETAGFHYFTNHSDEALAEAVREGRRRETGALTTGGEFVDPQDVETFEAAKLNWSIPQTDPHASILNFYRDLIRLRKGHACLNNCRKDLTKVAFDEARRWMVLERNDPSGERSLIIFNFSNLRQTISVKEFKGKWSLMLWSGSAIYGEQAAELQPPDIQESTTDKTTCVTLAEASAALYIKV